MLPAFSHFFHLTPADLDDMSEREVSEYLVQLEQMQRDGGV